MLPCTPSGVNCAICAFVGRMPRSRSRNVGVEMSSVGREVSVDVTGQLRLVGQLDSLARLLLCSPSRPELPARCGEAERTKSGVGHDRQHLAINSWPGPLASFSLALPGTASRVEETQPVEFCPGRGRLCPPLAVNERTRRSRTSLGTATRELYLRLLVVVVPDMQTLWEPLFPIPGLGRKELPSRRILLVCNNIDEGTPAVVCELT
ncbi:uncharacterized protein B0T23DRAFT_79170 [Neurospora hispaniola]|uniref:Uncharacterized protein n=1 Tax=Neurospora hispaniola TaxID=588809 RepID=A0AAJ0ICT7_9PEZI|nr:hypothetical protein B0T23DRAFT_79170 [Neurospora hispaniola]